VDQMTFSDGVLGDNTSVKGFKVVAKDGRAGRVSWATYTPGESYLVLTVGRFSRKHHVLPAGAVTSVRDREVHVALSRSEVGQLPLLPHPEAVVGHDEKQDMVSTFENAAAKWPQEF
jgi:hypothetical protein